MYFNYKIQITFVELTKYIECILNTYFNYLYFQLLYNIVVESSESEASDIEATSPGRKDIASNFIKKDEVWMQPSCYIKYDLLSKCCCHCVQCNVWNDSAVCEMKCTICYKLCSLMYQVDCILVRTMCFLHRYSSSIECIESYVIPTTHRRLANHAFAVAAPSSWSCLPVDVLNCQTYTHFLSNLKAYLLRSRFHDVICYLYYFKYIVYNASELRMRDSRTNSDDRWWGCCCMWDIFARC